MNDERAAAHGLLGVSDAQPDREPLTSAERMLIRIYRQLDEGEQAFIRQAVEGLAQRREQS